MATRFCIKDSYRENPRPVYFLDDPKGNVTFQPDVIPRAEAIAVEHGLVRLIDVGCGWADKLELLHRRHPSWDLTGIDYGDNLTHCRKAHDWGTWLEVDLEQPFELNAGGAVIVCSDVIEHLADPTNMLAAFRSSGASHVVFSTPERDVQYGADHGGPSPNLCHIREWTLGELVNYLWRSGFAVAEASLTRGNNTEPKLSTSLVVAVPR